MLGDLSSIGADDESVRQSVNQKLADQTLLLNANHIEVIKDFCIENDDLDEQSVLYMLSKKLSKDDTILQKVRIS